MLLSNILCALAFAAAAPETWTFDRLDRVGGHPTTIVGHPKMIDTPLGRAVEFNGVDDALFFDVHPLAGAATFTYEVIFRPASGGRPEQRFFHLQEEGSQTRLLLETRLIDGKWCLDAFAMAGGKGKTLIDRTKLHSLDEFHHAAMVYDGKTLAYYVDGVEEGRGEVALIPQGKGRTSVGVRINKIDYFKGAVRQARFSRRALTPAEFLKLR